MNYAWASFGAANVSNLHSEGNSAPGQNILLCLRATIDPTDGDLINYASIANPKMKQFYVRVANSRAGTADTTLHQ